jgi:EAL domain-containing protein (putative c-di-GMP-specific phosphodiesterase class I)
VSRPRIAIDDFGTGYSSLAYLHRIPAHCLKIDQSFVGSLPDDDRTRHIVESTLRLAGHLGLSTVAEGIETEQQYQMLESLGCEQAQGFWIARPMSGEAMTHWLERHAGRPVISSRG